jgi:predicted amidophosphoribosyltransferase
MTMTLRDWDNAQGEICSGCGREAMRIQGGFCPRCFNQREAEKEAGEGEKRKRSYGIRLFNQGRISLSQLRTGHY